MALEFLIPLAIDAGKTALNISAQNNTAKKIANFQRDVTGNSAKLYDSFNSLTTYYYNQVLNPEDIQNLGSLINTNLVPAVAQNPKVFTEDTTPYTPKYARVRPEEGVLQNFQGNDKPVAMLIDQYLDQKNNTPATQNLSAENSVQVAQGANATSRNMPLVSNLLPIPSADTAPVAVAQSPMDWLVPVSVGFVGITAFVILSRRA